MKKQILHEGKFRRFVLDEGWEYVDRVNCCGVVVVIPVTDQGEIILVEQYRPPVKTRVIEFPAGLANDLPQFTHETLEEAAKRELLEETGFQAERMKFFCTGPSCSASSSDVLNFFLATGLKKVGPGGGDEFENIQVHVVPTREVIDWLETQRRERAVMVDLRIYAGLFMFEKKLC